MKPRSAFQRRFPRFWVEAARQYQYDLVKDEPEYKQLSKKCDDLFKKIDEKLGKDWDLIDRFDEAKCNEVSYGCERLYLQGFRDCIYLLRWLRLF